MPVLSTELHLFCLVFPLEDHLPEDAGGGIELRCFSHRGRLRRPDVFVNLTHAMKTTNLCESDALWMSTIGLREEGSKCVSTLRIRRAS
eukprot:5908306-Amphidinium_carterae.2